jgi:hypothetical protein
MLPTSFQKISKLEIARAQLDVALRFYLKDQEYIAAITLAGAAEEILGKMAAQNDQTPSLKRKILEVQSSIKTVWGDEVKESVVADLKNKARNELKHICSGDILHADLEHEAALMLERTLENFILSVGSPHPSQEQFVKKRIFNWRQKQLAIDKEVRRAS